MTMSNKNNSHSGVTVTEKVLILIFVIALHGAALYFLFAHSENYNSLTHQKTALGVEGSTIVELSTSDFSSPSEPTDNEVSHDIHTTTVTDKEALIPASMTKKSFISPEIVKHEKEPQKTHRLIRHAVHHTEKIVKTQSKIHHPVTPRSPIRDADKMNNHESSSRSTSNNAKMNVGTSNGTPAVNNEQVTPAVSGMQSLGNPPPDYPVLAVRRHQEGTVVLRIQVLSNGSAGDIIIEKSSKSDYLDNAAVETVKRWHFIPARRGDVPIDGFAEQTITFRLPDS